MRFLLKISIAIIAFSIPSIGQIVEIDPSFLCPIRCDVRMQINRKKYSESDQSGFKLKYDSLIGLNAPKSARSYTNFNGDLIGHSRLLLDAKLGFAEFYYYSCYNETRYLDFGSIEETNALIKFIPEFPEGSTRRQTERRLIKVKWGGLELLVPDEDLKQFSERAAGLYIPPEENFYDLFFWIEGERLDRLVGLPEYPKGFGEYSKRPISGKILQVLSTDRVRSDVNGESRVTVVRRVVLSVGRTSGVRNGMKFDVGRSRERIVVESVSANTSIARSDRPVFKNKEFCNDVGFEVKCLAIVKGTFVKTRIGDFPEW